MISEQEVLEALDFFEKRIKDLKAENEKHRKNEVDWKNLRIEYEKSIEQLNNRIDELTKQLEEAKKPEVVETTVEEPQSPPVQTQKRHKPQQPQKQPGEPIEDKEEETQGGFKPIVLPPSQAIRNYRFAKTTEETAKKYKLFIEKCIGKAGEPFKLPPETAALHVDVSTKAMETYMKHLLSFKLDGKPLVLEIKGNYYANFDANKIIDYLFEEVE